MSIIYEALKKTEKNRKQQNPPLQSFAIKRKKTNPSAYIFLGGLISITVISLVYYFHHHPTAPNTLLKASAKPKPVITQMTDNQLVLNGVFISEQEKFAMINHRVYHVGATIDDMQIIGITQKNVKLRKGEKIFLLTTTV